MGHACARNLIKNYRAIRMMGFLALETAGAASIEVSSKSDGATLSKCNFALVVADANSCVIQSAVHLC